MMKIKEGQQESYEKGHAKNQDSYGACIYRYARKWAELMELQLDQGKKIYEIADKTSHEADTEGITGFMYGAAVSVLAGFWEHGEELRKWHNKEYDHEGDGVVNPAILNIKTK